MKAPNKVVMVLLIAGTVIVSALATGSLQARAAASELFISEYVEGKGYNKAIEIYNGTGTAVDLIATGGYTLAIYFNGNSTAGTTIALTGTVAAGDVYVVADDGALATILAQTDQTSTSNFFTGNDTIILYHNGVIVDVIGQRGFDPGLEWGSGLVSTKDNTLRRQTAVCAGDTDETDAFDPAVEWDGFANNTIDGLGTHTATCAGGGDVAPTVSSTTPTNSTTNVAINSDIEIVFSEAVTTTGSWATISCTGSGAHTAVSTGGPIIYTLNPDTDFSNGDDCTVTVVATQVTDQDGTVDNMAADYPFTFSTVPVGNSCGDPATLISTIQGSGLQSSMDGTTGVSIEGVVVGDYQDSNLNGFHVQEEDGDADGDAATSEGIYVYEGASAVAVNLGDVVRVAGDVIEYNSNGVDLTELSNISAVLVCSSGASVTPTVVNFPVATLNDWEAYENMLVTLPQTLTVSGNYNLGRYGQVDLSYGRLFQPTHLAAPGAPALTQLDLNKRLRLLLDDGDSVQNSDPILYPDPGLSAANTLRAGDMVAGLTVVLEQRFGNYQLQPVGTINFTPENPRSAQPTDVGGRLTVASFNVLNYFNGDGQGGGFPTSRGADSAAEFTRQRDKIIAAMIAMDADVLGLMEIENDGYTATSAIQDLVNGLNAATAPGTYNFIDPGVATIGTDAIAVGLIYKTSTVSPVGNAAILDTSVDPIFLDTKNRPVLAQTFAETSSGEKFTVAVNHLKSKGSNCDSLGDPDTGDGQGNCNQTRTNAATALVNWLANDPTGSNDPDFMIIGDLNSYAMEDPITALKNGGYTDLLANFVGSDAYTYVYRGETGYLDYALANSTMLSQTTGTIAWHINTDEPRSLDYNTEFKSLGQINSLYNPDAYRASDHDPVIVGLDLGSKTFLYLPLIINPPANRPVPLTVDMFVDGLRAGLFGK